MVGAEVSGGGLVLRVGIVLGILCAVSGTVSAGAAVIRDAKKGTDTERKVCLRRVAFSALTFSVVSAPALFLLGQIFGKLRHREKETWGNFLRRYDLATVICYGIAHIPNPMMAGILKLCATVRIPARQIEENAAANSKILEDADFFTAGSYIENQSNWKSVRFGFSTMAYSGCEIMAVYNALLALGKKMTVEDTVELISAFEKKGAVLQGKWGTSPYAIFRYFLRHDYEAVITCSKDAERVNATAECCETLILTAYNNRYDIRNMIHTVSVTRDEKGNFILHNAYKKNSAGEYIACAGNGEIRSLREVIRLMSSDGQAAHICIIGISRPNVGISPFSQK